MYWVQEAEQGTEMEGIVWQCAATVSLFHSWQDNWELHL
jgi:hypothetical protein